MGEGALYLQLAMLACTLLAEARLILLGGAVALKEADHGNGARIFLRRSHE